MRENGYSMLQTKLNNNFLKTQSIVVYHLLVKHFIKSSKINKKQHFNILNLFKKLTWYQPLLMLYVNTFIFLLLIKFGANLERRENVGLVIL